MLTILTIPKAFRDNIDIIQTNAIKSWTLLKPECEIILFGNDEGVADAARKLGAQHIPEVECNEYGTPLLSSVFKIAHKVAKNQLIGFVNTDIILMSDFLPALKRVHLKRYLMVGLRWDLVLNEPLNFDDPQWEAHLRKRLAERGKLHPPGGGGDYFIFPRGLFEDIPPFAIGRTAWDNWLIYRAREVKAAVIDATTAFTNIHQNHDYSHHPQGTAGVWQGPEAKRNVELMGGKDHSFTTEYATHLLTPQGVEAALSPRHIYFRMRAIPALHQRLHFLLGLFKTFERLVRAVRSKRAD